MLGEPRVAGRSPREDEVDARVRPFAVHEKIEPAAGHDRTSGLSTDEDGGELPAVLNASSIALSLPLPRPHRAWGPGTVSPKGAVAGRAGCPALVMQDGLSYRVQGYVKNSKDERNATTGEDRER
jgi:hypothetical protein